MDNILWKSCNIVLSKFHSDRSTHPLALKISREHAGMLKTTECTFIACLQWWPIMDTCPRSNSPPEVRNQFVTLETLSDDECVNLCCVEANSNGNNVLLFASHTFIRHYQFDSLGTSILGFKIKIIDNPVVMTSITLCANTEESYHWAYQMGWCTNLTVGVCTKPILCRQGDVCMFPFNSGKCAQTSEDFGETDDQILAHLFNLIVLESQPVRQGVLGLQTALTIVKAESLMRCQDFQSVVPEEPKITQKVPFRAINYPQLIELYSKIVIPYFLVHNRARLKSVVELLRMACKCAYNLKAKFEIQIVAKPPFLASKIANEFDAFHVVFATSNTIQKYGLTDLSWVAVQLAPFTVNNNIKLFTKVEENREENEPARASSGKRYAQLCAIENHWDEIDTSSFGMLRDNVAYVTPLLWFNLNTQPSNLIQVNAFLLVQNLTTALPFGCQEASLPSFIGPLYADEVHICLINSPWPYNMATCDKLLEKYFSLPRFLCEGDVFCLIDGDEFHIKQDNGAFLHDSKYANLVYFYVTTIMRKDNSKSLGFLVDRVHTSMFQKGLMQFYIPLSMEQYFSPFLLHPIWHSPEPCGLKKQWDHLAYTVMPYLKSSQLRKTAATSICLHGPRACGKTVVLKALARQANLQFCMVNCWDLIGESPGATEARLKLVIQKASTCAPCLLVLKNVHAICRDSDGVVGECRVVLAFKGLLTELLQNSEKHPPVFVGTTTDPSLLSPELSSLFLHYFKFEIPNVDERLEILNILTKDVNCGLQISLKDIAQKTSGFVLGDLCSLTSHALATAFQRINKVSYSGLLELPPSDENDLCLSGVQLLACDFDETLTELQAANSDAIGAPKIPDVKWEDVGGLEYAKEEILDTVQLPLRHPELMAAGLRRSGVLLYGPPGTGKTLLAKAVANECALNFLSVKGPELINMYVGQSEENVRNVFQKARAAAPCIIFFDELDSLAPNRGGSGDSGGVMDRVVSQLLAEIDGLQRSVDVFVMGATNRPDLLDPALLRPGRFDKLLYVRIPSDRPSQLKIIKALTRKFHLDIDVNLSKFVEDCPTQLTGADFYALCSDAMLRAMSRNIQELDKGNEVGNDIVVIQEDLLDALNNLTPSVSDDELMRYALIETTGSY